MTNLRVRAARWEGVSPPLTMGLEVETKREWGLLELADEEEPEAFGLDVEGGGRESGEAWWEEIQSCEEKGMIKMKLTSA
jgi:hypothetical protein